MDDLSFAVAATFVAVAAFVYYVGLGLLRARSRARVSALAPPRAEAMEAGFVERAIAPAFDRVGGFAIRLTPVGWASRANQRLTLAGWGEALDASAWAAIKLLGTGTAVVLWLLVQGFFDSVLVKFLFLGMLVFVGFFGPDGILNARIDERRRAMRNQLPDILDLLVISVEAGLGFDAALARVVETVPGEMSAEFRRMLRETRVGVSRRDAMAHLADRTDVEELDSFLLAMGQADSFGVSVARVLRVQAEEIRVRRRQRAQERAVSAPVKMTFPLVFCIFPALFVLLLGPAVIQVWENIINR